MKTNRNLWPFGIIAAFVLFLSGTAALVVLACCHRSDLVSGNYYEDEVRYQDQMNRAGRAQRLNSKASVAYEAGARRITISLPANAAPGAAQGRIQFYRPSEAGLDRQLNLELDANGVQTIDAADLKAGLWKVRVTWSAGGEEFFLDQKIIIGARKS